MVKNHVSIVDWEPQNAYMVGHRTFLEVLVEAVLSYEHHGPPIANKIDTFLHVVEDILI